MAEEYDVRPESPYAHLSTEETRAWYAYMKVHLRLRYELNRRFRIDSGISLTDYDVLVALISETDLTLTVSALATRIGWERSRVSHQVKRMAERGLLLLQPNPTDRRSTKVSLSEAGRATLAQASAPHADFIKDVFFASMDDQTMPAFATALEAIYEDLLLHGTLPRPEDHP